MTLTEFAARAGLTRQRVHLLLQLGRIHPRPRLMRYGSMRLWRFSENAQITQPKGRSLTP